MHNFRNRVSSFIKGRNRRRILELIICICTFVTFFGVQYYLSLPTETIAKAHSYMLHLDQEEPETEQGEETAEESEGELSAEQEEPDHASQEEEEHVGEDETLKEEPDNTSEVTVAESSAEEVSSELNIEPEPKISQLSFEKEDDFKVTVSYAEDAVIPEDAVLEVREIPEGTEEYQSYYDLSQGRLDQDTKENEITVIEFARFFDISFIQIQDNEQIEIEPQAKVDVLITLAEKIEVSEEAVPSVVHFAEEETEIIEAELVSSANLENAPADTEEENLRLTTNETAVSETDTFSFTQESFSVSGILISKASVNSPIINDDIVEYNSAIVATPITITDRINDAGKYVLFRQVGTEYRVLNNDGTLSSHSYKTEDGIVKITNLSRDIVWDLSWPGTGNIFVSNGVYINPDEAKGYSTTQSVVDYEVSNGGVLLRSSSGKYITVSNNERIAGNGSTGNALMLAKVVYDVDINDYATRVTPTSDVLSEGYYLILCGNSALASEFWHDPGKDRVIYNHDSISYIGPGRIIASSTITEKNIWHITPQYSGENEFTGYKIQCIDGTYLSQKAENNLMQIGSNADEGFYIKDNVSGTYLNANYYLFNTGGTEQDPKNHNGWREQLYKLSWNIWFDGTNTGDRYYSMRYANVKVPNHSEKVYLDENVQLRVQLLSEEEVRKDNPWGYDYVLGGWYDIVNNTYYSVTDGEISAPVYGDTIFYADWFAPITDVSQEHVVNTINPSFIHTDVFDYSELFNIPSVNLYQKNVTDSKAAALWEMLTPADQDYLFVYSAGIDAIWNPKNRRDYSISGDTNTNNGYYRDAYNAPSGANPEKEKEDCIRSFTGRVSSGILNRITGLKNRLFDIPSEGNNTYGKRYMGTGNNLYRFDPVTGYYYYDSKKNAATFGTDGSGNTRFFVHDYTNYSSASNNIDSTDFLPFNDSQGSIDENRYVNYWFGMKSVINFFLPNTVDSSIDGNKSVIGEDMVYRFSGDDDVWVQVDGVTLLDLGGIHDVVYGEINFSKGTVTIAQNAAIGKYDSYAGTDFTLLDLDLSESDKAQLQANGYLVKTAYSKVPGGYEGKEEVAVTVQSFESILTAQGVSRESINRVLSSGNHQMEFMYLERGSSESNAAIYFNIAPSYELNFAKLDPIDAKNAKQAYNYWIPKYSSETNGFISTYNPLAWAEFKVYYDYFDSSKRQEADLEVHEEWTRKMTDPDGGYIYTSSNGIFRFKDLIPGRSYYLVETRAPNRYRIPDYVLKGIIQNDELRIYQVTDNGQTEELILTANAQSHEEPNTVIHFVDTWLTNIPEFELPETGGPGDWLFKGGGGLLMCICGILLLSRKRSEVKNE